MGVLGWRSALWIYYREASVRGMCLSWERMTIRGSGRPVRNRRGAYGGQILPLSWAFSKGLPVTLYTRFPVSVAVHSGERIPEHVKLGRHVLRRVDSGKRVYDTARVPPGPVLPSTP